MSHKRMPTVFVGHGTPTFFLDLPPGSGIMSEYSKGSENFKALQNLPLQLNAQPSAIVIISAHWEGPEVLISAKNPPTLYHDFYGFPKECFETEYPAPTLPPSLSSLLSSLLSKNKIEHKLDFSRGWDHGVYIPLKIMFPLANIPIVAISMVNTLNTEFHLKLGKALSPLRDEGVLIIGSGAIIHELKNPQKNISFVNNLEKILSEDPSSRNKKLEKWREIEGAKEAHKREDHFIPLLVVAGAAENDYCKISFRRDAFNGAIINSNFIFGS